MDKIKLYIRESYNELVNKVTWPTWNSLQNTTRVVVVASIIFALVVTVMDAISKNIMEIIYGL